MFPLMFGTAPKQPLRMTRKMILGRRLIYVHCAVKSTLPQNVVNVSCITVRNVSTRTPVGTGLFIEQSGPILGQHPPPDMAPTKRRKLVTLQDLRGMAHT